MWLICSNSMVRCFLYRRRIFYMSSLMLKRNIAMSCSLFHSPLQPEIVIIANLRARILCLIFFFYTKTITENISCSLFFCNTKPSTQIILWDLFFVALKLLLEVNRTGSTKAATGRKADG